MVAGLSPAFACARVLFATPEIHRGFLQRGGPGIVIVIAQNGDHLAHLDHRSTLDQYSFTIACGGAATLMIRIAGRDSA
jgi:hypothetical protein